MMSVSTFSTHPAVIWTSQRVKQSKRIQVYSADRKIAMTVKDYRPPTAVAAMDRTTLARNDKLRITSMAQGSECSGMLTYRWSASDGRIAAAADSPQRTLTVRILPLARRFKDSSANR